MFGNYNRIACAFLLTLIGLRLVARAVMPHTYLVPDEGTWSNLTNWLVKGKDLTQFPGFDRSPFYGSQSLIVPSAWQVEFLNISSLNAVRNTSLIYGIGCLIVFFYALKLITRSDFSDLSKKHFTFAMGALLVYGLMPSHLFWSLVGLRDSASEFFLLLTVYFVCKSLLSKKWRWSALPLVGLFLVISFSARAQTAWVLCALVGIIGLMSMFTKTKRPELIALAMTAFFIGQLLSEVPSKILLEEVVLTQGDKSITLTYTNGEFFYQKPDEVWLELENGKLVIKSLSMESESSAERKILELDESLASLLRAEIGDKDFGSISLEDSNDGPAISFKIQRSEFQEKNILQGASMPIERLVSLQNEREAKRLNASSSILELECSSFESNSLVLLLCPAATAIYQFFSFLFRPLIIETATSLEFTLAAYENLLWFAMFVSVLFFWLKLRWRPNQLDLIPVFFFLLFAPAAAMTQGNLGTAMRHKSIVLWTFLWIALSIYLHYRKNITTRQVASETDK